MRSENTQLPDLIYRESQDDRIRDVRRCFESPEPVLPEKLHRVTIFTTFRCNLKCCYCNTIRIGDKNPWPSIHREYDFKMFRRFVDQLNDHKILHLHFTGGEATLVSDLPQMIAYAAKKDVLCSMTSNGTAPISLYRELVDCGLKEIRVSCDTHVPDRFDKFVGRVGTYKKVVETIKELTRMRDQENKDIFIIINMCVGHRDLELLPDLIKNSVSLGPDDIKLIGPSHERGIVWGYEHRMRVIMDIKNILNQFPESSFPLLNIKLRTIFTPNTYGLKDRASRSLMKHCFIPLTERVVDAEYFYPCPVYLREGGAPLGRLDENSFEKQQAKIFEFARGETCIDDSICRESCIFCCKKFNLYANYVFRKEIKNPNGGYEPISARVVHEKDISTETIYKRLEEIDLQRKSFSKDIPYVPFLVIKPNGMAEKNIIMKTLAEEGAVVKKHVPIPDWNAIATGLYSIPLNEWRIYKGILMEQALPEIEGSAGGELLILEGDVSINNLNSIKYNIRSKLPPDNYLILHREEIVLTAPGYVHSPDADTYWMEANLLLKCQISNNRSEIVEQTPCINFEDCMSNTSQSGKPVISVLWHCMHVGEIASEFISRLPVPVQDMVPEGTPFLSAIHDIGKVSPYFQKKYFNEMLKSVAPGLFERDIEEFTASHAQVSEASFKSWVDEKKLNTDIGTWGEVLGCHHEMRQKPYKDGDSIYGGSSWQMERHKLIDVLAEKFPILPKSAPSTLSQRHIVIGIICISDWIAFNEPFTQPEDMCENKNIQNLTRTALDRCGWV